MQTIIVKLEPGKLENPDLDLRYIIPDEIEEESGGLIQDNGYDYLEGDAMGIWLKTDLAEKNYPLIVRLFQKKEFLRNDLSKSAEIYISDQDAEEIENCTKVYPE